MFFCTPFHIFRICVVSLAMYAKDSEVSVVQLGALRRTYEVDMRLLIGIENRRLLRAASRLFKLRMGYGPKSRVSAKCPTDSETRGKTKTLVLSAMKIKAEGELMVTLAAAGRAAEDEEDEEDTWLDNEAVEIPDEDEYVG
ncbi:hypothetical protein C8R44DRAFT_848991 [Mycena epipterygia]|nr:hypothetical protein C8R44DRAFT_848991 [Mycena epipterygia]